MTSTCPVGRDYFSLAKIKIAILNLLKPLHTMIILTQFRIRYPHILVTVSE
jgi:heme O synthase-like polyprenyltransferase